MSTYEVRRFEDADWPAVLDLMRLSLGWRDGDPNEALFQWKHRDNPFGPSPAWVAVEAGQVIGFRTFMRWEFEDAGRVVRAVRAVDTATHPQHQGRGIFKRLTLHAVDELREEGVEFVFNTPNDQSRPGYLKMGWQVVGRLPVVFRPRSLASLPVMARSRTAADLWSTPTTGGAPAAEALAGLRVPAAAGGPAVPGLRTHRTSDFWRWRYGLEHLHYRVLAPTGDVSEQAVVFRVRRRGTANEAALCDVLGRPAASAVSTLLRSTRADYAVAIGRFAGVRLPAPGLGPILTWLPLQRATSADWSSAALSLGDVELF